MIKGWGEESKYETVQKSVSHAEPQSRREKQTIDSQLFIKKGRISATSFNEESPKQDYFLATSSPLPYRSTTYSQISSTHFWSILPSSLI